jgi:hypothetical protein
MTSHLKEKVRGLYHTRRYWTGTIIQILPEDKYRIQWTANGKGRPVKYTVGTCSGMNLQAIPINRDQRISIVISIILAVIYAITLWTVSGAFFGVTVENQRKPAEVPLINVSGPLLNLTTMEYPQRYYGLLNEISLNTSSHEGVSHYTRNINISDVVDFLRNSHNYLFERAQMDGMEKGQSVNDYLKKIRVHTSNFIQGRELYGREELMDRLM